MPHGFDGKMDYIERSKNARCNKALKLLDHLIEEIGFDEEFTKEYALECLISNVRSKDSRAWFGQGEIDYLRERNFIEEVEQGIYVVTSEGMMHAENRERTF